MSEKIQINKLLVHNFIEDVRRNCVPKIDALKEVANYLERDIERNRKGGEATRKPEYMITPGAIRQRRLRAKRAKVAVSPKARKKKS